MKESKQAKRTRRDISEAMLKLMLEKDFDSISVTDICESAMITRATFYKYFEDKYHLFSCILEDLKEQIFENELKKVTSKSQKEIYLKLAELCVDFVNKNQKNFVLFLKHCYNDRLIMMILKSINDYIETFTKKEEQNFKLKVPAEVSSKFITGGFAYFLVYALENNKNYTKQELLAWTEEVLNQLLKN
ncbi:MAG: TetR/AcrR family transcriptional regulator [Clostridia bacterium]|nr:TetR/AcrR family transcriptional regulator [Clostridia bacterium]